MYWGKDRQIERCNTIGGAETDPHTYEHLIMTKVSLKNFGEGIVFLKSGTKLFAYSYGKK